MHINYQQQLSDKIQRINAQFASFLTDDCHIDCFDSPEKHFRQRAEFRIWHRQGDTDSEKRIDYAMFEKGKKGGKNSVITLTQLPIASQRINDLMPRLLAELRAEKALSHRLFQVEFLSTLRGDMLISLIYHRRLDDSWQALALDLEKRLDVHIIGRSKKQKIVVSQDFVTESFTVFQEPFNYRQIEGGFSQPNAYICEKMLHWTSTIAQHITAQTEGKKDLLELYCGNANFTLPLSRYFNKVLATEIAKTSVAAARHNIAENRCDNIAIARLSAQELTQAFNKVRPFNRLLQDNIDVDDYDINTIFVDPPRAGIDNKTLSLMQTFEHILYISCNPDTLYDNLQILKTTHQVKKMALFDQFPYTHHVEMGVWLKKF